MNRNNSPAAGPTTSARATRSRSSHSSPSRHVPNDAPVPTVETTTTKQETPRVVMGYDAVSRLPNELGRLCLSSPLIVCSPSRMSLARRIQSLLPNLDARILDSDSPSAPPLYPAVIPSSALAALLQWLWRGRGSDDPRLRKDGHGLTPDFHLDEVDNSALPAVIIYDEKLTMSHPKRFSAPSGAPSIPKTNTCRSVKNSSTAQWSFIHLPGV
ncbi:hypothetical protein PT974_06428 [Cladobotryum mycophilum]|uniref:Uncharacterized protein n=1 Tax=Cladobotryum mycophilum TaxID=491253 RepID=A0ABR0SLK5_9HYPO